MHLTFIVYECVNVTNKSVFPDKVSDAKTIKIIYVCKLFYYNIQIY